MHKLFNIFFLGVGLVFLGSYTPVGATDNIKAHELGDHYKNYYMIKVKECRKDDHETFEIKHPEATKRFETTHVTDKKVFKKPYKKSGIRKKDVNTWPVINRKTYSAWLEDVKRQIETIQTLIYEEIKKTALILEIEEIDIEDNKEELTEKARILFKEEGFLLREKEHETLTNFYRYLDKHQPEALVPTLKLSEFMKYLKENTDYKMTNNNKIQVKDYLKEYYFIEDGN